MTMMKRHSALVALMLAASVTACGSANEQDGSGIDELGSEGSETDTSGDPDPVGERITGIGVGGGTYELTYRGINSEEEEEWGPAAYVVDDLGRNWLADGPGYKLLVIDDDGTVVDRYELDGLVRGIADIEVTDTHVYVLALAGVEPIVGRFGRNDVGASAFESFSIPTQQINVDDITGLRKRADGLVSLELTYGREQLPLFSAAGEVIADPGAPLTSYTIAGHEVSLHGPTGPGAPNPRAATIEVDSVEVATIETEGTLGDFRVIGETPDGELWIHVSDVGISDGNFVVRSLAYRLTLAGEVIDILEMPMRDEIVWVEHRIALTPTGELRVLSTSPDEVTLRRPTRIGPVEAHEFPPGVSPYLPSADTITPPPQHGHGGEQCMHRDDIMQRAFEYVNFEAIYNSNHMQTCAGRTPVSYFQQHLGQPVRGVAYKYAGYQEVSTYADAVANNYTVGDLNTQTDKIVDVCSYGVDCSGFVTKAWRSSHQSTGTLHNVSWDLSDTDELEPGDALNKPYSHVRLVAEHLGMAGVQVVEATVGSDRMRVVTRPLSWASAGYGEGYKPVRYDNLCPNPPPPPPPSTHVIVDVSGYFPSGSDYTPIAPVRLLDTRQAGQEHVGALINDQTISATVAGRDGIPGGAQLGGVVLNLTVTDPQGQGYVAVFPDAAPTGTSNVNFQTGRATPNLVIVDPGADNKIDIKHITDLGSSHIVIDAFGWFPNTSDIQLVTPARVFDSRQVEHGATPLAPGETNLQFAGVGGIPLANVSAVIANITVVNPVAQGYATVYRAGTPRPTTSNLNFWAGAVRSNLVVVPVSTEGLITLFTLAEAHYIVDVFGWIASGSDFSPISPIRLRDTRVDDLGPPGDGAVLTVDIDAAPTIPNGIDAVLGNLTAVGPTVRGHLDLFTAQLPVTSNLNFGPGDTVANAFISGVLAQTGEIHVMVALPP